MPAVGAAQAQEAVRQNFAFEERVELVFDELRQASASSFLGLSEKALGVLLHPAVLRGLLGSVALVVDRGAIAVRPAGRAGVGSHALGMAKALGLFAPQTPLVFVCGDGRLSRYAAQDALALGFSDVCVLAGGRVAWRQAGLPTERCSGDADPKLLTATDDMWYPPYARQSGVEEAMQQYLTWEVNLLEQLAREPHLCLQASPATTHKRINAQA